MKELFDKILAKRNEFNECALRLHFRGLGDIREETIPLLNEMLKGGYNVEDFKLYLKERSVKVSKNDVYLRSVIKYLNKTA